MFTSVLDQFLCETILFFPNQMFCLSVAVNMIEGGSASTMHSHSHCYPRITFLPHTSDSLSFEVRLAIP